MIEIYLVGTVATVPVVSHKSWGENFYKFTVDSARASGTIDSLICIASEVYLDRITAGERVEIRGNIRSFKTTDGRCEIYVFADDVQSNPETEDQNEVWGDAYISRVNEPRETPLTHLIIADVILKSVWGGDNNKYAYIPSIAWSRNAIRAAEMEIGTRVNVCGRFQSRQYVKALDNGETELRTAYELSLAVIDEMEVKDA